MKRSFGQFKQIVREKSLLSADERALLKAFQQGEEAARSDEPRHCPYAPFSEQEKAQAWFCGYDERSTRYVLATQTKGSISSPALRESAAR